MLTATRVPPRKSKQARRLALFAILAVLILGELALHLAKHRGWTTYTADDGLADSDLTAIAVAPDSAVWVGTVDDISCFDGSNFNAVIVSEKLLCSDIIISGQLYRETSVISTIVCFGTYSCPLIGCQVLYITSIALQCSIGRIFITKIAAGHIQVFILSEY